jgi:hypothetical protein
VEKILKKACLIVEKNLQKNKIFNSKYSRDNIFDRFIVLKKTFKKYGYDLCTNDIHSQVDSDLILYLDPPSVNPDVNSINKSYLILCESPHIQPTFYKKSKHVFYKKIFTWHDDYIDNIKYFKLNLAHKFPKSINKNISHKRKLIVMVSGNKNANASIYQDLYSERKNAIRWFEKYHINDFDLYGTDWDKFIFVGPKIVRIFNKYSWFAKNILKILGQVYPSYRGTIKNKKRVLQKYRFALCYENSSDIPGYVTEKIFDCFFAGCVPIYRGANNITKYIPKNCFIDKRDFNDYESLYVFIKNMDDGTYKEYLSNIEKFIKSNKKNIFTSQYYASFIYNHTTS